jgi:hypothetical protein
VSYKTKTTLNSETTPKTSVQNATVMTKLALAGIS